MLMVYECSLRSRDINDSMSTAKNNTVLRLLFYIVSDRQIGAEKGR